MATTIWVLVVDDYEAWRRFVSTTLRKIPQMRVIGEAFDGPGAVLSAQRLRPDLIVLDIGLAGLNGSRSHGGLHNEYWLEEIAA